MNQLIQEYVDSRGVSMRVDRRQGIIRGVKILGVESRNGRVYSTAALSQAVPLYENAKVNVNHPKGPPDQVRDYQDRIGIIRNVRLRPDEGLFADLYFNPKHALAEQLIWDAEHMPENVGFSHNVVARTGRQGDRVVVEAIARVQSVDLVADPATTRGLFEAAGAHCAEVPAARAAKQVAHSAGALAELTLDELCTQRPDLVEAAAASDRQRLRELEAEIGELRAAESLRRRRELVDRLLEEHGLPTPDTGGGNGVVDGPFYQSLLEAADEETVRRLVAGRAALVGAALRAAQNHRAGKPQSRMQFPAPEPIDDVKAFLEAITA